MTARKRLVENMLSLLVLQGASYVLPLITFPYLVRVLGPAKFGLLAFAQAFLQYFVVVTDYGFNLSATREVAVCRDDRKRLSEVFSAVMLIKIVLMAASFTIMAVIVVSVARLRADWPVYFCSFGLVVGTVLFPVWLFQGVERMKYIVVLNLVARILATVAIFTLVRREGDYILASAIQAGAGVVAGVLALPAVSRIVPLGRLVWPPLAGIRNRLRDGWHVFVSMAGATLFNNSNIFILGFFASQEVLGYFAVAERVVRAAIGLSIPISTAIYPRASALFADSRARALAFLRKILLIGGAAFLVVSVALFSGADVAVFLVTGRANPAISVLIRIMSVLPLTIFLDNIYGTQILLNVGLAREFMRAILCAGAFSVVASLMLVPSGGALASAAVFTLSELLVLILMMTPVHQHGIRPLRRAE